MERQKTILHITIAALLAMLFSVNLQCDKGKLMYSELHRLSVRKISEKCLIVENKISKIKKFLRSNHLYRWSQLLAIKGIGSKTIVKISSCVVLTKSNKNKKMLKHLDIL